MTRRRELERHRRSLNEIREIMNSMKSLAYLETCKLARFLDAQHAAIAHIENVAGDFLAFYPEALPRVDAEVQICIAVGSERGFCGELNQVIERQLLSESENTLGQPLLLITVGRKLENLFEGDDRVVARIAGASVAEEVPTVLSSIVGVLSRLQQRFELLTVHALYHEDNGMISRQLLPPFQSLLQKSSHFSHPPELNLSPEVFMFELAEHYLFTVMHELLYVSLMVENYHRMTHLESAVQHLDEKSLALTHRANALRQEEIIEEIEVILLSAGDETQVPSGFGFF